MEEVKARRLLKELLEIDKIKKALQEGNANIIPWLLGGAQFSLQNWAAMDYVEALQMAGVHFDNVEELDLHELMIPKVTYSSKHKSDMTMADLYSMKMFHKDPAFQEYMDHRSRNVDSHSPDYSLVITMGFQDAGKLQSYIKASAKDLGARKIEVEMDFPNINPNYCRLFLKAGMVGDVPIYTHL